MQFKRKRPIPLCNNDRQRGQATVDRMAEKVKARGARVIETFTLNTKDKDIETLINDTEVIIDILDLKMYSG